MFAFIIFLLISVLTGNQACKDEISDFIQDTFHNRGRNGVISEIDYDTMRDYYGAYPVESLEAINDIGSGNISRLFIDLLRSRKYSKYNDKVQNFGVPIRNVDTNTTFVRFNNLLVDIFYNRVFLDRHEHVKLIKLVPAILRRINYSDYSITVDPFLLAEMSLSTKDYINSLWGVVRNLDLVEDPVKGFERAFYILRGLSLNYPGGIPPKAELRTKIYSLLFTCSYYSHLINLDNFKAIEPESTDPHLLAFLLRFRLYFRDAKSHFSSCGSINMVLEIIKEIEKFTKDNEVILAIRIKNNLNSDPYYQKIIEEEGKRNLWYLKALKRLSRLVALHQEKMEKVSQPVL
jgi:hypothetical protein